MSVVKYCSICALHCDVIRETKGCVCPFHGTIYPQFNITLKGIKMELEEILRKQRIKLKSAQDSIKHFNNLLQQVERKD